MDILTHKKYEQYNYRCRYTNVPYYFNTKDKREIYGIGFNLLKNASCVQHKVKVEDTLDSLALKYYNNPTYWWVIAYYNDIQDAFIKLSDYYTAINIPNVTTTEFGDLR